MEDRREFLEYYYDYLFYRRFDNEDFVGILESEPEGQPAHQHNSLQNPISVFKYEPKEIERCLDCSICMEIIPKMDYCTLDCKHTYCYSCIYQYLQYTKQNQKIPVCALCRNMYKNIYTYHWNHFHSISKITSDIFSGNAL